MDLMNLIHGDCLIELKTIKDNSIDFVYLDLPFGQTQMPWDNKIDLTALWIELKRIAKNDRTPFFFSCNTKFGFELFNTAPKGWFRWDLSWEKNKACSYLTCYRLPMRKHEMIYCFAKQTPKYDVSSHKELISKGKKYDVVYKENIYSGTGAKYQAGNTHKDPLPTSVLKFNLDEGINHRTAKPVKLMEFLLKYWTKEGDTILDPTAGSGSMGMACMNMNRKFIGIEKDPDIFNIMKDRLEKHSRGEKVLTKYKKKSK